MSESLSKGARGGVKDLRKEIDPLVKDSTPGIAKTSLKSGSVPKRSVGVTVTGITRPHALAVRQVFSFPGGGVWIPSPKPDGQSRGRGNYTRGVRGVRGERVGRRGFGRTR